MNGRRGLIYWCLPLLLPLILYWPGFVCWFQKDDFAWLGLRDLVHNGHDLRWALFAPLAQGTIRTLSERVFYLSFTALFGLNPLPFRMVAFATFLVVLVLLMLVTEKLTGSRWAGFWAAMIYTINQAIAVPLSWTPVYYEIACCLVFLTCVWLLIRFDETGKWGYYWAQWIVFLIGFGVLELNVVYPALALAYAICRAPRLVRLVLPLFIASAAYTVVHMIVAPLRPTGVYAMHWDASMLATLWNYWKWALGPSRLILVGVFPSKTRSLLTIALMVGVFGFLAWKLYRREWSAAFCAGWFVIVLAPLLPLRDHMSDYYLTVPLLGVAMLAGWGVVEGWRSGWMTRSVAVILLVVYASVSVRIARATTISFHDNSRRIRSVIESVVERRNLAPGKVVLLTGVDDDLFWSALVHRPFRLYHVDDVYLLPENAAKIHSEPGGIDSSPFFISDGEASNLLRDSRALVLKIDGSEVSDVSAAYRDQLR